MSIAPGYLLQALALCLLVGGLLGWAACAYCRRDKRPRPITPLQRALADSLGSEHRAQISREFQAFAARHNKPDIN